jgi:hypothetical protein
MTIQAPIIAMDATRITISGERMKASSRRDTRTVNSPKRVPAPTA